MTLEAGQEADAYVGLRDVATLRDGLGAFGHDDEVARLAQVARVAVHDLDDIVVGCDNGGFLGQAQIARAVYYALRFSFGGQGGVPFLWGALRRYALGD